MMEDLTSRQQLAIAKLKIAIERCNREEMSVNVKLPDSQCVYPISVIEAAQLGDNFIVTIDFNPGIRNELSDK